MKILEISHLYPVYYDPFLGMAIHKQVKHIKKLGCEVKVICPTSWTPFPVKYLNKKWKNYSDIPIYNVIDDVEVYYPRFIDFPKKYFLSSSGVRMYYGIKSVLKKISEFFPFDLVHAHTALGDGYAGMLIAKEFKKPLVVTIRGTDIDINLSHNKKCYSSLLKVINNATKIISPSFQLSEKFNRYFKKRKTTICNGIETDEIYTNNKKPKKYQNYKILLSVSRLISTKGIDFNLYALKELVTRFNNIIYLIIGEGPFKQYLNKLAIDLGVEKYVIFLGQLPHKKVLEYMSICDIFVMPSWQETFGLVYLEAMAHGKPIIGCKSQGIDGVVKDGETGLLVKQKDIKGVIRSVGYLLNHDEEAKLIGKKARKLVLKNYTWEKNAEKTINIYKEAICDNLYNRSTSKTSFIHPRDRTSRACP